MGKCEETGPSVRGTWDEVDLKDRLSPSGNEVWRGRRQGWRKYECTFRGLDEYAF